MSRWELLETSYCYFIWWQSNLVQCGQKEFFISMHLEQSELLFRNKDIFVSCWQFIRSTVFISKAQCSTRCPERTDINIVERLASASSFVCKLMQVKRTSLLCFNFVYDRSEDHTNSFSLLLQKTMMVSTSDDRCHKNHFDSLSHQTSTSTSRFDFLINENYVFQLLSVIEKGSQLESNR